MRDLESEARAYIQNQRSIDAEIVQSNLAERGVGAHDVSNWTKTDWSDDAKVTAKIHTDMAVVADREGYDLSKTSVQIATLERLTDIYLESAAYAQHEAEAASRDLTPDIVQSSRWHIVNGMSEERIIVVQTEAGYHPGYETSWQGAEGSVFYSDQAYDNPAKAMELASVYQDSEGDEQELTIEAQKFDANREKITDLLLHGQIAGSLSVGEAVELNEAMAAIGAERDHGQGFISANGYASDETQRAAVLSAVNSYNSTFNAQDLVRDVSAAGYDHSSAASINAFVEEKYGSEERYLLRERARSTLNDFARTGRLNTAPALSDDAYASFVQDIDAAYGREHMKN